MSKNGKLFNSKTDPIPRIRPELDIVPIENNGESYLYFHDTLGYATDNFAVGKQVGPLLSMFDGQKSIQQLKPYLGEGVSTEQLLDYIQFLDKHRLLLTSHFKQHAEQVELQYESSPVHPSVTAGNSYPADPVELRSYLDDAFSKYPSANPDLENNSIKALYAPHIDPRVGMESYVKAFSSIKDLQPKRVVVLATSHYSGMHPDLYDNQPFIVTRKDFDLPLDTIKADQNGIDELAQGSADMGVSTNDRAHRIEHSIELHLLFLSYLWNHDFQVIPILVRSFDELLYKEDGHLASQVERFGSYMNKRYGNDEDTLFLISGDLAHIGKKFGDDKPASHLFSKVKSFDRMFMTYAQEGNRQALFNLMKEEYDPYRICGFAPLFTFLKSFSGLSGKQLSYDLWDETERESGVTFGSIVYSH